jgi:16S rRNA (uracil1498-N3)-methyltransferase
LGEVISLARFFLQSEELQGNQVTISGDDAHHIARVLRLRVDDEIECVDPLGQVHRVIIRELGSRVLGVIQETVVGSQESPLTLTLFQGLAKGDKMDLVIQKAVELGVDEVIPFSSRYTVVKLDEKQARKRQERWQRIALEAAKQSGRTIIPVIGEPHTFAQVLAAVKARRERGDLVVLAYEGEKHNGLGHLNGQPMVISAIVGPEGGFAPDEVEQMQSAGVEVVTLGPRILRTETAGLVLLSIMGYKWGDLR